MTQNAWNVYRETLGNRNIILGKDAIVFYYWNFGTISAQRDREYAGKLDIVDNKGVIMDLATRNKRFSYKVIKSISTFTGAYDA